MNRFNFYISGAQINGNIKLSFHYFENISIVEQSMIMMNYIDPRVLNVKTYLNESKYQIEFSGFCGLYLKCFRIRAATYKNLT